MRSALGLPTGGSGKSSTTCISTRSLWICYFRNLIISQQSGGTTICSASSPRCYSSLTRSCQHWLSTDLDRHTSYMIQLSRFRSRSKAAGQYTSARIKLSSSPLRHASSTSFDSVNQQWLLPMEHISDGHSSSAPTTLSTPLEQQHTFHHPRWFNTKTDIDLMLEKLKSDGAKLDKPFIFKCLRSMLYNVSQYKHGTAWKIYQAMLEHNVASYMRSNQYGHLLNIIKYAPDATPKLIEILDHMKTTRIVIEDRHYSQIMFGMSRQGNVVAICDLLRMLADRPSSSFGVLQPSWYTSLALAAKRNGDLTSSLAAAEIMEQALKQGVMMERRACAVMISALSIDVDSTVRFITAMKETGMMVVEYPNNNNNSNIEATLETKKFNVHIYTSLISGMALNGDEKNAWRLWKAMRKNGLKPTTVTYAALMEAYGRSGNVEAAVDLMKKYTFDNNGQMNKVMATSVLTNCIRHGKLDLAQSLLSSWMDTMNLTTDSKMDNEFWSAVMWLKVTENVAHARDLYESLIRQNSHYVDSVMVNHLVKGYGKAGQKENVLDSFQLHKRTSSTINAATQIDPHFFLVDSLFRCRDVPAALTALVTMREHSVPDDITIAMVIRGLVMNGEDDMAWQLFRTLKSSGVEPNLRAYSSILKTCIKNAKRGAIKQRTSQQYQPIPMDIVEASLKIGNAASLSTSTGLLGKKRMGPAQAYILFRKMTGYQKPNVYTYTTLIACFAKHNIGRAVDIFTHMCADGVEPVIETYVALLQGCAIFRSAPMALLVFNNMQEKQLIPNDKVWHYLLKALARTRTDKKEIDRLGTMVRTLRQQQNQDETGFS